MAGVSSHQTSWNRVAWDKGQQMLSSFLCPNYTVFFLAHHLRQRYISRTFDATILYMSRNHWTSGMGESPLVLLGGYLHFVPWGDLTRENHWNTRKKFRSPVKTIEIISWTELSGKYIRIQIKNQVCPKPTFKNQKNPRLQNSKDRKSKFVLDVQYTF